MDVWKVGTKHFSRETSRGLGGWLFSAYIVTIWSPPTYKLCEDDKHNKCIVVTVEKWHAYLNQKDTFVKNGYTSVCNKHLWLPVSQYAGDSDMIQESTLNFGISVSYLQGTAENWNGLARQNDQANCFLLVHTKKHISICIYIYIKYIYIYIYLNMIT